MALKSFEVAPLAYWHIGAVEDMAAQSYDALPIEYWQRLSSDCRYRAYVATDTRNGRAIGFMAFRFLGSTLFIDRLVVAKKFRRNGIGQCLLGVATNMLGRSTKAVAIKPFVGSSGFITRSGFTPMSPDVWIAREDLLNV